MIYLNFPFCTIFALVFWSLWTGGPGKRIEIIDILMLVLIWFFVLTQWLYVSGRQILDQTQMDVRYIQMDFMSELIIYISFFVYIKLEHVND